MLFGKRERAIRRILVVEDEALVAFDNEQLLKDAGYEVVATVDSLEDARQVIADEALDLVLTDIGLSGEGTGIHVAELAHAKGVAVLFVTGNCPGHAKHLAVGCLSKPYSGKVLQAALDAVDAVLRGKPMKKIPENLTIFHRDAA